MNVSASWLGEKFRRAIIEVMVFILVFIMSMIAMPKKKGKEGEGINLFLSIIFPIVRVREVLREVMTVSSLSRSITLI